MNVATTFRILVALVALVLSAHVRAGDPTLPAASRGEGTHRPQAVRTVCSDGCDYPSIVAAIASSQSGDEIVIGPGTHIQYGMWLTIDLTLTGAGRSETIIDGNDLGRVFFVDFGADVLIRDLTILGGAADGFPEFSGGAILNSGRLTLRNCELRDNYSQQGGGAVNNNGDLTIEDCVVTGNDGHYGAVYNDYDAQVVITQTAITGNEGVAGVSSDGLSVVITRSLIQGNSGHGVYAGYYTTGPITVDSSTIAGNSFTGIFDGSLHEVMVTASTIADNVDFGLYPQWSYPGAELTVDSSIIANNQGGDCAGVPVFSSGYNLASDSTCGLTGVDDQQSLDPMLAPLAENSGPTATFALAAGSPAIDVVPMPWCKPVDQRGVARPIDGDGDGFADCDAGAYELFPTDPDADGIPNGVDNCVFAANPGQEDADGDRVGDACDNCPSLSNPSQGDSDADDEGDFCDVDDGLLTIHFPNKNRVTWDAETAHDSWNIYGGDLFLLRATGFAYAQLPGSNPLALRVCGQPDPWWFDSLSHAPGSVAFYLSTGVSGGVETTFGVDSNGAVRLNANPCP